MCVFVCGVREKDKIKHGYKHIFDLFADAIVVVMTKQRRIFTSNALGKVYSVTVELSRNCFYVVRITAQNAGRLKRKYDLSVGGL